jgi:hypothetical protein
VLGSRAFIEGAGAGKEKNLKRLSWIEQKGMTFNHDFGYSFYIFSLKKRGE